MTAVLNEKRILTFKELKEVPVQESNEELVRIDVDRENGIWSMDAPHPFIRSSVWSKLKLAGKTLMEKTGYGLQILYAYRLHETQVSYFEQVFAKLKTEHPEKSDDELIEMTHLFVAVPEVAGHPTGAAVDLTIVNDDGPLDMGCEYPDFDSPYIKTFADGLTDVQKTNRDLLREVMMNSGFAPFNGEWWHFSYGDREWAAFYGEAKAMYSPVSELPESLS